MTPCRGPFCFLPEHIIGEKVYYIRVLISVRSEPSHLEWLEPASVRKSVDSRPLLSARKLAKAVDERSHEVILTAYDVAGRRWNKSKPIKFCVETTKFDERDFNETSYPTYWIVKK